MEVIVNDFLFEVLIFHLKVGRFGPTREYNKNRPGQAL